jgi:hypothetical protein
MLTNVTLTANFTNNSGVSPGSVGAFGSGGNPGPASGGSAGSSGANGANGAAGSPGSGGPGGAVSGSGTIVNSTIAANTAGSLGGGLFSSGTPATETNTIVASNTPQNCGQPTGDGGNNLSFGDGSCPGNAGDPKLGPLQDNGGPTATMALLAGSAAIDAIAPGSASCAGAHDQRGVMRPQGGGCDIGAYELAPPAIGGIAVLANGPSSVIVGAQVNANAQDSIVFVQFGPGTAYGYSTPGQDAGSAVTPVAVSARWAGVAPGQVVHYRFVASNADGTSYSPDQTLTVPTPPATIAGPQIAAGFLSPGNPLVDLVIPGGILRLGAHSRTVTAVLRNHNPFFVTGSAILELRPATATGRRGSRAAAAPTLAGTGISIPGDAQRTLYLSLDKHMLQMLRSRRHLPVQITLRLFDQAGHSATVKGAYLLAAPSRRGRPAATPRGHRR